MHTFQPKRSITLTGVQFYDYETTGPRSISPEPTFVKIRRLPRGGWARVCSVIYEQRELSCPERDLHLCWADP